MVCPYCGTRNSQSAVVCGQCGAILRDSLTVKAKSQKKASQVVVRRKIAGSISIMLAATIVAFGVGDYLGRIEFEDNREFQIVFGLAAAILSMIIMLIVSFGRLTLLRFVYRNNRRKLTDQVSTLLKTAEEAIEDKIKAQNTAGLRFHLASVFLLGNDLEKSIQQFEQAQQLQAQPRPPDLNNWAVALAMRGQLGPAFERLDRAVSLDPPGVEPRFNLSKILNQTGRDADAKAAESKLTEPSSPLKTNADLLNQLGIALAVEGKTDEAIRTFEKAGTVNVKGKDYVNNMRNNVGIAHAMVGNRIEAQAELNGVLKAEPENARAAANLGVLLINQRRYKDAIERLSQALHLEPELAVAHCDLGYAHCMSGTVNEGIREFRAAVLLEPNIFEAQYNLGKAYLDEGVFDFAERSLIRAAQLRRTSWHVHHALGVLYYTTGLIEKALASFTESLKYSPYEPVVVSALAVCYVQRGNRDIAEQQLTTGVHQYPENAELYANLSWVQILNEELHEATNSAKRAIAVDEALAQPHNNLGLCQLNLGAPEVALDAFKKALSLDPSLVKIHYHLGNTHIALKQVDNAIKEWNEASQSEPGNGDVYTNLGVALYRQGRIEDAILEFRRVLKVRSERKEDYINLGLALASAKHHKEAIEQFDKALALDPRNAVVHSNRGLACYFANNVDEALREWQLVTQLDPAYAKRRGKKQESEYDDAIIEYIPLYVIERAMFCAPHSGEFLYRYLPGYETDKWLIIPPEPELAPVSSLNAQIAKINRQLRALDLG